MSEYTVYIDEAGDLGINRGTKWFVLTAVIVAKNNETKIRARLNQIKERLNVREIHLRKINDFFKRGLIAREISEEDFTYMNILVDTSKIDPTKLSNPATIYNYSCKFLLQRVSWYLNSIDSTADIVLSARGTSKDNELIQYISEKLLPFPDNQINQSSFEKVCAKSAGSWDLLQLADICATTMFLTYEVNGYGFSVPCFTHTLQSHLYSHNGNYESYGIKFFASNMKPGVQELRKTRVCAKKERVPGATTT